MLTRVSPLILAVVVVFAFVHGLTLIPSSDGGSDLVSADIPKSLMLLSGQNPYSVQPWASPYPPFLLLIDSGLIRLTSLTGHQSSVDVISQNLRVAGLAADTMVALAIYFYVRHRINGAIPPLISASLFLMLPALSISPLYFFHSDTFGYPILALSIIALASNRSLIGTTLLAVSTIFKIHPLFSLPLVLVWLGRTRGARSTFPSLLSAATILTLGLASPLAIPGYAASVLGFNLSNNGDGTTLYRSLTLANGILPSWVQITPTTLLANQIWLAGTFTLFTVIMGAVWTRAKTLNAVDTVLLGLLAWLIPLKIEYTHYVAWAIIPVLMRGRIKQTILVLALLQVADTLSYWSWWPNTSPVPGLDTFYGLVATSIVYRTLGLFALGFVLYRRRMNPQVTTMNGDGIQESEGIPAGQGPPFVT